MNKFLFYLILSITLVFGLTNGSAYADHNKKKDINRFDSIIYVIAQEFDVDPVMVKAHAMVESSMRPGVTRNEQGYLTGRYEAEVARTAKKLKTYANKEYGSDQSLETWKIDLSKSYGLIQMMGQKAYELGWRGYSFLDPEEGLVNPEVALYYGIKLMSINLKRYNGNLEKAISAYNAGSYTERNRRYINEVLAWMKKFEKDFDKFK